MEIPKNLDAWHEGGTGPVVLVVQPRKLVAPQSSITHAAEQPFAMLFDSRDAAADYHKANNDKFKLTWFSMCVPVIDKRNGQSPEPDYEPFDHNQIQDDYDYNR